MTDNWLYGWKEICQYIGCSRSTALRHAKLFNMPIYRRLGKPRALKKELDVWLVNFDKDCEDLPREKLFNPPPESPE